MRAGIRSIALAAVLAVTIAPASALAEDPTAEAKAALSELLGGISATARDESLSADQKRALIEHDLAIWIDFGHMSAVALGPRAELFSSQQLAEFYQEPFGIGAMLEADQEVVGVPDNDHVTSGVPLSPLVGPQVEDVVDVYVRQQRRNRCTLR